MSLSDSFTLFIAVAGLLIGALGLPPLYKDYFDRRKEKDQVVFAIDRFEENGQRFIGVLHPDKLVRNLNVLCDGQPSPPKNNTSKTIRFDVQVEQGGAQNFLLPTNVNSQSLIIVRNGDRTLGKFIFKDIQDRKM